MQPPLPCPAHKALFRRDPWKPELGLLTREVHHQLRASREVGQIIWCCSFSLPRSKTRTLNNGLARTRHRAPNKPLNLIMKTNGQPITTRHLLEQVQRRLRRARCRLPHYPALHDGAGLQLQLLHHDSPHREGAELPMCTFRKLLCRFFPRGNVYRPSPLPWDVRARSPSLGSDRLYIGIQASCSGAMDFIRQPGWDRVASPWKTPSLFPLCRSCRRKLCADLSTPMSDERAPFPFYQP